MNNLPSGHQNAIKKVALARRVGIPVRRVRDIIEHMQGEGWVFHHPERA